jgi:hypothetical protein
MFRLFEPSWGCIQLSNKKRMCNRRARNIIKIGILIFDTSAVLDCTQQELQDATCNPL